MTITRRDRQTMALAVRKLERMDEQRMRLGRGDAAQTLFVSGRTGFVYARPLMPSTATASQVRCRNITPAYGLPVIVKPGDDGILEVISADPRMEDAFAGSTGANFNIAVHGNNHGRYGPDPVFLKGQQYLPLAVIPSTPAAASVYVNPGWYVDTSGAIQWYAGGTVTLSSEIAALTTNQQRLVIIALDRSNGSITKTTGTAIIAATNPSYDMPFTSGNIQDISTGTNEWRLQAVRIYASQTTAQLYDLPAEFDLRWARPLIDADIPNSLTIGNGSTITIKDENLTIQDDGDTTKQFKFQASGITAGQTRVLTVPNYDGTIATLAGTETLTNKTLTSPIINTPTISGGTINNAVIGGTTPAAGTFTDVIVDNGASNTFLTMQGDVATGRGLRWRTGTSLRWQWLINTTPETGSNAGSNIVLSAIADDGSTTIGNPIIIIRSNLAMFLSNTVAITNNSALTNTAANVLTLQHNTSGTPAAGFGSRLLVQGESSTTIDQSMFDATVTWVVATHASRTARVLLNVYDTAARECIRMEASGTAPMLGFYGSAAIAKQAVTGSRGGNAALASLLTALATLGLITDSSTV